MKCPMKFNDRGHNADDSCDEACAWLVWDNVNNGTCSLTLVALGSRSGKTWSNHQRILGLDVRESIDE